MNTLDIILAKKRIEIAELKNKCKILYGEERVMRPTSFKDALTTKTLAIIAEIKRKSPSKGDISPIENPVQLAEYYIQGGANALSILTDKPFFNGEINDLKQVAPLAKNYSIPILRKDFIIDEIQISEAYYAGASAVLLIVAVLGKHLKSLLQYAHSLGLDVLVEIYDYDELQIAIDAGANIIGINNRNLKTLTVDTSHAFTLVDKIPDFIIKVAESGIADPEHAQQYFKAGFNAVLIGESLVKSMNPQQFIKECRYAATYD